LELEKEDHTTVENPAKSGKIIGEKVKIKIINKDSMGPEDYYYLKKFENKTGTVCEQNECKSGIYTYKVEFAQKVFGYFYNEDFLLINENKPI
jgi:hypothetical protein